MSYNVAIDGPAGAGKSTIAKAAAKKLGLIYVDTGAMYRAMALFMLREGLKPETAEAQTAGNGMQLSGGEKVDEKCLEADITIGYQGGEQVVYLNGENVTGLLRTEEVGRMASVISQRPAVRRKLVELQQKLAAKEDCIMDGRDIGTCVLPKAQVKIYLTAGSSVRALRRYKELLEKGQTCDLAKIQADIEERDYRDMHREASPLKQAEDAVLVDTSDLNIEEAVLKIMDICREKKAENEAEKKE